MLGKCSVSELSLVHDFCPNHFLPKAFAHSLASWNSLPYWTLECPATAPSGLSFPYLLEVSPDLLTQLWL